MAILDKEILSYVNTQANLISLLSAKYRGIDSDQGKNWSYADGAGTFHVTANQKYWDGVSDWVYEDNDFGDVTVHDDLYVNGYIYNYDDTDTYIIMAVDQMGARVGNIQMFTFDENSTQDTITFVPNNDDVDFSIEPVANAFFLRGSDGFLGLGTGSPSYQLSILNELSTSVHIGNTTNAQQDLYLSHDPAGIGFNAEYDESQSRWEAAGDDANYAAVMVMDTSAESIIFYDGYDSAGGVISGEIMRMSSAAVTINESGANCSFRVEGNTDANLLATSGGADCVLIGTDTQLASAKLTVLDGTNPQFVGAFNATDYFSLAADDDGDLTITTTGTNTILPSDKVLLFGSTASIYYDSGDGDLIIDEDAFGIQVGPSAQYTKLAASMTHIDAGSAFGFGSNYATPDATVDFKTGLGAGEPSATSFWFTTASGGMTLNPSGILELIGSTGNYCPFLDITTVTDRTTTIGRLSGVYDAGGSTVRLDADNGLEITTSGNVLIGDNLTDMSKFESDGTLVFEGDATVWEDANIDLSPLQTGGTKPGFATPGTSGIRLLAFAVGEDVDGTIEIPHAYKLGSNITAHIHWVNIGAPSGTDYVKWELDYWIVNNEGTVTTDTTITTGDVAVDTDDECIFANFTTAITHATLGGQIAFKIKRVAATGDAYGGECGVLTFGFHYEIDTVGSRTISTK